MKRVLLVEDDATIRRFVLLALEDLPLVVVEAATLDAATTAMAQAAFDLVITDLMLPDGHGLDLVAGLRATGNMGPVLLFSAGISAPVRERAAALRVAGILEKPVSMRTLVDAVQRAISGTAASSPAADHRPPATVTDPARPNDERQAIDTHFAGNEALFLAFKASSLRQLQQDSLEGDRAAARGDRAALRLLAHSLKTVLGLLGHPAAGEVARGLEKLAAHADAPWEEVAAGWAALRDRLPRP